MTASEIDKKRDECIKFLKDVLHPRLQHLQSDENDVRNQIREYEDLACRLRALPSSFEQTVDLGYDKVFVEAVVEDTKHAFVHVGMGIYVELNISEATEHVRKRMIFLREEKLRQRCKETEKVRNDILQLEMILDGLAMEIEQLNS